MKHKLRDIMVQLIDTSGISFLYRWYVRKKGPLVRVIAFHDVADAMWFEEVVTMLTTHYNVITPAQFERSEFDHQKINVLLTFDDGYQSWIDNCLPILETYKLKGLFFINSGLLDIAENADTADFIQKRLYISPKEPLTWTGTQELIVKGHSLGGHTVTHPHVALLEEMEIRTEVVDDKQRIESMLGITLSHFAYPFGRKQDFSAKTIELVKEAGYTYQYSAITGFAGIQKQGILPRTLVEKDQQIRLLRRWIDGAYDVVELLK